MHWPARVTCRATPQQHYRRRRRCGSVRARRRAAHRIVRLAQSAEPERALQQLRRRRRRRPDLPGRRAGSDQRDRVRSGLCDRLLRRQRERRRSRRALLRRHRLGHRCLQSESEQRLSQSSDAMTPALPAERRRRIGFAISRIRRRPDRQRRRLRRETRPRPARFAVGALRFARLTDAGFVRHRPRLAGPVNEVRRVFPLRETAVLNVDRPPELHRERRLDRLLVGEDDVAPCCLSCATSRGSPCCDGFVVSMHKTAGLKATMTSGIASFKVFGDDGRLQERFIDGNALKDHGRRRTHSRASRLRAS